MVVHVPWHLTHLHSPASINDLKYRTCQEARAELTEERARKPAPKEVLVAWAEQWTKEGIAVD